MRVLSFSMSMVLSCVAPLHLNPGIVASTCLKVSSSIDLSLLEHPGHNFVIFLTSTSAVCQYDSEPRLGLP